MARSKMAAIDRARLTKRFKESLEGKNYVAVATALFKYMLTSGLKDEWSRLQGEWAPLSDRYKAWKRLRGMSTKTWEATGGTLKAITSNAPTQTGTKKKLQFGINFVRDLAFARPRAFKKAGSGGAWRELSNGEFQAKVFSVLRYGNAHHKVARYAEKKGHKASDYIKLRKGEGKLPGRPLMVWPASAMKRIQEDVAAVMSKIMNGGNA